MTFGFWTVIERDDRKRQWAYKGKPVYRRVHAYVTEPLGKDVDEDWHVLRP